MKIYTKTGDKGETGLFNGSRVGKDSLRVDTYGTVDELNSVVGLAVAHTQDSNLKQDLTIINNWLFNLGSDLATPLSPAPKWEVQRVPYSYIEWLENKMDSYEEHLPKLKSFILPGGSRSSAFLHNARTVCRRAERLAVHLNRESELSEYSVIFLNRLSDYLFMAARYANHLEGVEDKIWNKDV